MTWENISLAEVELQQITPITAGRKVFQLLGAGPSERDPGSLEVRAVVAEGDDAGKRVFFKYPDPKTVNPKNNKPMTWSLQAAKLLEQALGVDSMPGEPIVSFFNRVAQNGHARFSAEVTSRSYKTADGSERVASDVKLFSVQPAA